MPRRSAPPTGARPAAGSVARPPVGPSPARPTRPADIGGFRLVRLLDDDGEVATWVARGADVTVILRVFRDTAPDDRIDAETLARERLFGPCAPELLDVAMSPAGRPALIVGAIIGPTLDDVLRRLASPLRAGHLTTLLAPLAALTEAAHESGATLGRLDARSIRIDPSGRPVVVGLGHSAASAPLPERFRSQEPRIVADRARLDALAHMLAARVDPHERASVDRALETGAGDPGRLELALFDCAAPLPIADIASMSTDLRPAEPEGEADRAARVSDRCQPPTAIASPPVALESSDALGALARGVGLPPGLLAPLDEVRRALRQWVSCRVRKMAPGRPGAGRPRRPIVIIGALGLLSLGAAVVLSTVAAPASLEKAGRPASLTDDAPRVPRPTGAHGRSEGVAAPPTGRHLAESLSEPAAAEWSGLITELVDRWLVCAEAPEPACAGAVAHAASAASDQLLGPAEALAPAQEVLSSWAVGSRESVVVDRHGAAAIVDLVDGEMTTASLLIMRSEAGWRVRAVLSS